MKPISRSLFLKTIDCPVLGWNLYRNLVQKNNSVSDEFLIFEAKNIHEKAKLLFSNAVQIKGNLQESVEQTKKCLEDNNVQTLLEPVFEYNGFVAKADILTKQDKYWQIIEVKSGNKWKNKYISDIAYNSLIASKTINCISKAKLMLLSKDFRLGKPIEELFAVSDCTVEVFDKVEEYSKILPDIKNILQSETVLEPSLKVMCKNCDMFSSCMGKDIEYHIFDLPRLSVLVFDELAKQKIYQIKDIPETTELTQMQKVVKDCVVNDKIFVNENLKFELDKIAFPCYYLDFESVMTIYPLYDNLAPHTQVLTQYSIHKCSKPDNIVQHFEYIADPKKNCQKIIAKNLVDILETTGSIITYSSFEAQVIEKLIKVVPELEEQLRNIISRIVDLEAILKFNYYDKRFHGRTSIKKVLPVMIPEMNYDHLKIGEGGSALSMFAYMTMGLYSKEKEEEIKKNLLEYCKRDTLALVKMHKFLFDVSQTS